MEFSDAHVGIICRNEISTSSYTAPRTIDFSSVIAPTLFVHCDILEHVVVGDIMAPLLRIVNMEVTRSHAVHQIMNPSLVAICTKTRPIMRSRVEVWVRFRGNQASAWSRNRQYCKRSVQKRGVAPPQRKPGFVSWKRAEDERSSVGRCGTGQVGERYGKNEYPKLQKLLHETSTVRLVRESRSVNVVVVVVTKTYLATEYGVRTQRLVRIFHVRVGCVFRAADAQ